MRGTQHLLVIPGRDRRRAVIMADHYDTAYMEDYYDKEQGGNGARSGRGGRGRQPLGHCGLMLAAPLFCESEPGRPSGLRRLAGPSYRRGVPLRLHGRPALCQQLVKARSKCVCRSEQTACDLSGVRVQGVYVLDMVAHNNDRDRDVFQIAPGAGPGRCGWPIRPTLPTKSGTPRPRLERQAGTTRLRAAGGAAPTATKFPAPLYIRSSMANTPALRSAKYVV